MTRPSFALLLLSLVPSLVAGCGDGDGAAADGPFEIDNGFESDDPSGRRSDEGDRGGAEAGSPTAPAPDSDSNGDAARAVEEADILKLEGTRLYALSRYGGLAVVDVSDPDHLKLLGRKRTDGIPFEMYVRNGRAYVMLNEHGKYIRAEGALYGDWVSSSEIVAFDVTNPSAITEVASFDAPGNVADSRIVGDTLYLVTHENGYCWQCASTPGTVVTSFNVAGAQIAKVDQLEYRTTNREARSWQRSVSATNQRLYLAGPEWSWRGGQNVASSIIQVVDISNPSGALVKGADVPVAGQINSRWQMDEHEGVLRVVSQFGNGWDGGGGMVNPKVQTFQIASSSSLTKIGETDLVLTKPESLRSVRFDGARAYAITAERTDPLFTIDLSDPAAPRQAAALEIPGWIFHMEPRGDRLVGFGYDAPGPNGTPLAVTLFDVSDLSTPTELSRVSFGTGWAQVAEDQDRIHKSVRVLDDKGLVLVPFASSGRFGGNGCEKGQSGIQLIDLARDSLTLRGVAPQYGMPRRALFAGERLLAISDRNVTSFDVTSRDAPKKTGETDLSNPAYRMVEVGGHIASISNDWWTSEVTLSLTPSQNPDDAAVSGTLSLASLADPDPSLCSGNAYGWTAWYNARLFAYGTTIVVVVPRYTHVWDQSTSVQGGKVIVGTIDVSNPASPRLLGKAELKLTERRSGYGYGYYGDGFWDGWGFYSYYGGSQSSLVATGQGAVMLGTKLAYLEVDREPYEVDLGNGEKLYRSRIHRKLHVADLASAASPVVHAPLDLGESLGTSPLHLWNGTLLTSRWLPSNKNKDKVRFFVDRVDLSGPTPTRLPSINTPGSLLLADEGAQRLVTTDYHASRASASSWDECQAKLGWRAFFDYQTNDCVSITRDFKLSDVAGTKVTLRQTMNPPSQNIAGVQIADDRIYVTRHKRYDVVTPIGPGDRAPAVVENGGMWVIGGVRAGELSVVSSMDGDARWPLAASGTKVAINTQGGLAIYDTATATPTLLAEQNLRGWGHSSHVLLGQNRAICSLGAFGIQAFSY